MPELLLLADADVLIHFYKGRQLKILPKILPYKICILDAVKQELQRGTGRTLYDRIKDHLGDIIDDTNIEEKEHVYKEWLELVAKDVGPGESACLALARFEGHHIASSNLRDIDKYCETHKIRIYTTMDLLYEAYEKDILDKDDCDAFISDVLISGSRLPCSTFDEFIRRYSRRKKYA